MAIAFIDYADTESLIDESIGKLIYKRFEQGEKEDGSTFLISEEIPSHVCTPEELGLTGNESKFMPLAKNIVNTVKTYQKRFLCID